MQEEHSGLANAGVGSLDRKKDRYGRHTLMRWCERDDDVAHGRVGGWVSAETLMSWYALVRDIGVVVRAGARQGWSWYALLRDRADC